MKINSIRLVNYRNHSDKTFNFTEGLNLLVGKNGAGKSSVLEAFGLAMYGTGNRAGNKYADVIKQGEKTVEITIDFTGNDDLDYVLEFKYSKTKHRLLHLKNEKGQRDSDPNTQAKINEITGFSNNYENVFQNVVSVYQNQITSIFSAIDSERTKTFNSIFETDLYDKISKDFAKKAGDRYKMDAVSCESKIATLKTRVVDSSELSTKEKEAKSNLKNINLEIEKNSLIDSQIVKDMKVLSDLQNQIKELENNLQANEDFLKSKSNELEKNNENLQSALDSLAIKEDNQAKYLDYIKVSEEYKSAANNLKALEAIKTKHSALKDECIASEKSISQINFDILKYQKEIDDNSLRINDINSTISEIQKEIDDNSMSFSSLQSNISRYGQFISQFKSLSDESLKISSMINQKNILIEEKKSNLVDSLTLEKAIETIGNQIIELEESKINRNNIERNIELLRERISENKTASDELKTGLCPLLKESCQNVVSGKMSVNDFFDARAKTFEEELSLFEQRISEFEGLDKQIEGKITELAASKNSIKQNLRINNDIDKINLEIISFNKELENIILKEKLLEVNAKNDLQIDFTYDNIKDLVEKLTGRLNQFERELHTVNSNSIELKKRLSKSSKDLDGLQKSSEDLSKKHKKSTNILEKETTILNEKQIELNNLANSFNNMEEVRANAESLAAKLNDLKDSYELYIKNLSKANELPKFQQNKEEIGKAIEELVVKIEQLKQELSEKSNNYSQERFEELKAAAINVKNALGKLAEEKSKLEIEAAIIERSIRQNEKDLAEIKALQSEAAIIENKLQLTDYFRKKVKEMGNIVAKRFIERIEMKATENYQRISGKLDRLLWAAEEAYQVYLVPNNQAESRRRFDLLSGGEQVSVALSLRAAMAETLTSARFAIFDEPTINLDTDRRAALAESLNSILQDLEQSIIVTHDNSFIEIADNTVFV